MQLMNKFLKNGVDIAEYYLVTKMMKMSFKATWPEIGVFVVTEIKHRQKDKNYMLLFIYEFFSLCCMSLTLYCVSHVPPAFLALLVVCLIACFVLFWFICFIVFYWYSFDTCLLSKKKQKECGFGWLGDMWRFSVE